MIRHGKQCKECGKKLKSSNVTGLCGEHYRRGGSVVSKKVKKDKPCLYCKKKQSEDPQMYCDDCRKMLREETGWHWRNMLGESHSGTRVIHRPISEIQYI